MKWTGVGVAAMAVACVVCLASAFGDDKPAPAAHSIDELAWIAGDWELEGGGSTTEERWIEPRGGAMLGVSRTVAGGKMVFFEFLRIETRKDELFYVAQPGGAKPTPFKLVELKDQRAVFENKEHDFPKRILYSKTKDGLDARIEGDGSEKEKAQDFHFKARKPK